MKFFRKLFETAATVVWIAGALLVFYLFLEIIGPLPPVITLLVALVFTLFTLTKRLTAVLSIGGIILYAASWPLAKEWGIIPSLLIWALGIIVWLTAVCKSLSFLLKSPLSDP